ncbi:hypothetical protein LUR56_00165 [Streptomyces sp. MT29]|nr:hypothetical protein [Streptomyces sp. MT29]
MTGPVKQRPRSRDLLLSAEARLEGFLSELAELVAIDSGSYSPAGVNRVADWTAGRLSALGFAVERVTPGGAAGGTTGDVLIGRRPGRLTARDGGRRVLLAAHTDTSSPTAPREPPLHPSGAARPRPRRQRRQGRSARRAHRPGRPTRPASTSTP